MDGKTALLPQYRELLSAYTAELAGLRTRATNTRERAVLAEYEAALKGLTDIQLVWEEKDTRGSDMLPISEELPARIAREYDLGVNTNEPPSIYADEALAAIWNSSARASDERDEAARWLIGFGLRAPVVPKPEA